MNDLIWLIPLIPFLGFLINGLIGKKMPKSVVGLVGSGAVFASFLISCGLFATVYSARQAGDSGTFEYLLFDWIQIGTIDISFSFLLDPLSAIMILIITGVGFLIHLYSVGYMKADKGYAKYFAYLNLFVFFMLLLVLGSNYLIMFIGWEGVGLCSYLLIGFWYEKKSFASAGKKAFIMNRIGDLGFLLATFFIISTFGSLEFSTVLPQAANVAYGDSALTWITILLFVAATGKSAQLPLFTWLPDAMAGPTPVSALIHAATMVTAGIYMIARSSVMFVLSPVTMEIIAVVGIATALIAAFIALTQNDIKKVLAYSTVSQLGYMFLGLGVGAFTGAFFHVITHAFFKALLFLGAGSVIFAMQDEQDMRKMGGIKGKMPITYITMVIGTVAIAGLPPLSGFFSKDEILAYAFNSSPVLWVLGAIGALLTAFYMFRLLFMTFHGKYRGDSSLMRSIKESPIVMTLPLILLAILSFIGGGLNVPEVFVFFTGLANFLSPVFETSNNLMQPFEVSHSTEIVLMSISVVGALIMAFTAYKRYVNKDILTTDRSNPTAIYKLSYNKLYFDEVYDAIIVNPLKGLSRVFYNTIDRSGIDKIVNSVGRLTINTSSALRQLQSGHLTFYVFVMVIGVVLVVLYGFFGN